jgi:hypothetical protein
VLLRGSLRPVAALAPDAGAIAYVSGIIGDK